MSLSLNPEVEFSYKSLSLKGKEIRLLRLMPSADISDPIEGEIIHISLEGTHLPYEALSYEWGITQAKECIFLDGQEFDVRENLLNALHQLRRHEDRVLSVDAICIDQSNVLERNHQVGQMGSIYSGAWRVVVYLGPEGNESDHVIDFLSKLADLGPRLSLKPLHGKGPTKQIAFCKALGSGKTLECSGEEDIWDAVENMFRRPYWNRVWIVQEIVLGIDVQVTCGSKSIPWDVLLCDSVNRLGQQGHLPNRLYSSMPARLHIQRQNKRLHRCTLFQMLTSCRDSLSSDRRDKVFAFLGIADDCSNGQLQADYSKSVYAVCQETSSFLRARTKPAEHATVSALVYSSLGFPHALDTATSAVTEESMHHFYVIGHIIGVKRRGSSAQSMLSINSGAESFSSLNLSLSTQVFDQISSPDFIKDDPFGYGYKIGKRGKGPQTILGWSPLLVPKVQLPYSRHSNPGQTTCPDHWPAFLDTTGNGCISEDVLAVICYLFGCKRWIYINVQTKQVQLIRKDMSMTLHPGMTTCPGVTRPYFEY